MQCVVTCLTTISTITGNTSTREAVNFISAIASIFAWLTQTFVDIYKPKAPQLYGSTTVTMAIQGLH